MRRFVIAFLMGIALLGTSSAFALGQLANAAALSNGAQSSGGGSGSTSANMVIASAFFSIIF